MTKAKLAALTAIGALLGYGAFQIKQESTSSRELVAGNDAFLYENCLKTNEAIAEILPERQQDCESEYLEGTDG